MTLKTMGLHAAVAVSVALGAASTAPSVQAATLAPGTFNIKGTSSLSNYSGPSDTSFTLDFSGFSFVSKTPVLAGLTGAPTVGSLALTRSGSSYNYGNVTEFIKGISLAGKNVVFDLASGALGGTDSSATSYAFSGALNGTLRYEDNSEAVIASGIFGAFNFSQFGGSNEANIAVQTVPTPALLPGLLALGAGIVRKRKAAAIAEADADA